jgi:hypothetical protein
MLLVGPEDGTGNYARIDGTVQKQAHQKFYKCGTKVEHKLLYLKFLTSFTFEIEIDCNVLYFVVGTKFRRNVSFPCSGKKMKPSRKSAHSVQLACHYFCSFYLLVIRP